MQTYEQDQRISGLEVLRKSQQLDRLILDNAHDFITIHKLADLSYEYVNPATIKVLGYSQEELFAKSPLDIIHPDDINRVMKRLKEDLPRGAGQDKFRYRKKDGTYIYLEAAAAILPRENDDTAMLIISRDITDREEARASLQRQVDSQDLLLEISRKFANIAVDDIDDMINTTLQMISEFDNNDRSYICMLSDDQHTISNIHEWCAEGIAQEMESLQGSPVSVFAMVEWEFSEFETHICFSGDRSASRNPS